MVLAVAVDHGFGDALRKQQARQTNPIIKKSTHERTVFSLFASTTNNFLLSFSKFFPTQYNTTNNNITH